jgi:polycomb protein EED
VAGVKGLIRTIIPFKGTYKNALIGHGSSIHDLRFHPTKSFILLSSSKDYTMRLWNVNTNVCIAIFGGAEGHRDEVLSAVRINFLFILCLFEIKKRLIKGF